MLVLALSFFSATALAVELPTDLNKVFSYQCESTFLEGEGVTADALDCSSFQQIGLLKAKYTHYINEPVKQARDDFYPDTVCNLEMIRHRCVEKLPDLRFALATRPTDLFSVAVKLSPGPGLAHEILGYAALATKGKCPEGLALTHAYRAVPKTIRSPLPSSFLNSNGRLDDTLLLSPQKKAPRFEVVRERNNISCDEIGDCRVATFDQAVAVQRVDYKAGSQSICVVPKETL